MVTKYALMNLSIRSLLTNPEKRSPLNMSLFSAKVLLNLFLFCAVLAHSQTPKSVFDSQGMVASRSAIASKVGAKILAGGGNAIDAAVSVGFALAVTYPSAGNLGGGGFMVIRLADGTLIANDHREKAPGKATRNMYLDAKGEIVDGLSTKSHLASGDPGTVARLIEVLEAYGSMELAEVIQPAIDLAKDGFILDEDLADQFKRRLESFSNYPASLQVFSIDGESYEKGDRFSQPDLAETLERIKLAGKTGFYAGETADLIVDMGFDKLGYKYLNLDDCW